MEDRHMILNTRNGNAVLNLGLFNMLIQVKKEKPYYVTMHL